ncbi:hypothetical protein MD484_g6420, partial [Candolleomyces efflorescens]
MRIHALYGHSRTVLIILSFISACELAYLGLAANRVNPPMDAMKALPIDCNEILRRLPKDKVKWYIFMCIVSTGNAWSLWPRHLITDLARFDTWDWILPSPNVAVALRGLLIRGYTPDFELAASRGQWATDTSPRNLGGSDGVRLIS